MCGICGVVSFGRPPEAALVDAMSETLAHRGPDGAGTYAGEGVALGFRRLAIIDLSDAGMQPFPSPDGRFHLVFNGEIYNYRELRLELETRGHAFRTSTDTEVALAAFIEWGASCVDRFVGMWAFAVWDSAEQRLFASRDRFGIKPFYYRFANDRLVFASEPKALLRDPDYTPRPNPTAVADYLAQSYIDHLDETFFVDVKRLPPAHSLTLDHGGLRLHRYWSVRANDRPDGDAAEAVRAAFLESLRLHLRSDVPVGSCLSGGLDSSAIVVGVSHLLRTTVEAAAVGPRQRTFTAYFDEPGFDERPYAYATVDASGADAHWVTFDADRLLADLNSVIEGQDEPFGSTSMVAQWYVMQAAAGAGLTVMLDGQGGDEVFGGYRAFVGARLADALARGRVYEVASELIAFADVHSPFTLAVSTARSFASERARRTVRARTRGSAWLLHDSIRAAASSVESHESSSFHERLRREQEALLTRRGLPELLRYEDRNSMQHSLEARVPFLDHRLVELAFSLPGSDLIARGTTKSVVRRALGDLLPAAVRDRRDKLGFVTPERRWFRGALGAFASEVFASKQFRERGLADPEAATTRLDRHRRGEIDAGMELWRVLNLELWARAFLDRDRRTGTT